MIIQLKVTSQLKSCWIITRETARNRRTGKDTSKAAPNRGYRRMAFHIRCMNQTIRACRSAIDFLPAPAFSHTDRRVQSSSTVTHVDHGVSIGDHGDIEKILQQTANKKPTCDESHYNVINNLFDLKTVIRHDLVKERQEVLDKRMHFQPRGACSLQRNIFKENVVQNLEPKLGHVSQLTSINKFQCASILHAGEILLSNGGSSGEPPSNSEYEKKRAKREENLLQMKAFLEESLPPIFEVGLSFDAYSPNIVLENNYRGKREITLGLQHYKARVWTLQTLTGLRFIHTRMNILNTSCDLDENFVRVRWRVLGLKQLAAAKRLNVYGKFWKISKLPDRVLEKDATWYDGISFYYLNDEGLINKHVINRVEEDSSKKLVPALSLRERLARKMGVLSSKQI
ncbi:uncharacterized protein LOC125679672 [Ostrea edulis]|uniref:uncharacterized protein LOC125679672 n=1 Tax=Ostrea edulis TaxID=37623 RepID=UPI00209596E1|nr:uncharacterized protein LOC125679672 [Ostrea edulis]